jgi:hypothetical protein
MSTTVAVAPEPEQKPLSEAQRLINALISPAETFRDLNRRAAFWAPLLVVTLMWVIFAQVVDRKVGYETVAQSQLQMNQRQAEAMEKMSPEDREKQMNAMTIAQRVTWHAWAIPWLIGMLIISGVLLATLNFGLGTELRYKTVLAVVIYAALWPVVVHLLIAVVSLLIGVEADSFLIQNPAATNLAYTMKLSDGPALYSLLSSLDIIMFWRLALVSYGITCVSKLKMGTAAAVVFGWYAVLALISAGVAAIFA